jgi:hypothetical protein
VRLIDQRHTHHGAGAPGHVHGDPEDLARPHRGGRRERDRRRFVESADLVGEGLAVGLGETRVALLAREDHRDVLALCDLLLRAISCTGEHLRAARGMTAGAERGHVGLVARRPTGIGDGGEGKRQQGAEDDQDSDPHSIPSSSWG